MKSTESILKEARAARPLLMAASPALLDKTLLDIADLLETDTVMASVLDANDKDLCTAIHISDVMKDRLTLTAARIHAIADSIRHVASLPSPLGRVLSTTVREDGLTIEKRAVSIGVIGMIYESRPNVTADAAALALKSGNVCVLRGGKEAYLTSRAIVTAIRKALVENGLPEAAVSLVEDPSRESAKELMKANGYLDLLIPRGGAGLIKTCVENATVPCIQTGTGICHVYVDKDADLTKAAAILKNAKTSRPSVCNAAEVCLVHRDVAPAFLPLLKKTLTLNYPAVELRTDKEAYALIGGTPASDTDFDTEFLDYILAVGVVDDAMAAIHHIAAHSTGHSDAIVTENTDTAALFCDLVDSAAVYVNASTRFTDGGEFGFGCEIGISTQKLHARGPMGLQELTTYKYVVTGNGHVR